MLLAGTAVDLRTILLSSLSTSPSIIGTHTGEDYKKVNRDTCRTCKVSVACQRTHYTSYCSHCSLNYFVSFVTVFGVMPR